MLVQGADYHEWTEEFQKLSLPNENTDVKVVFTPEPIRTSTPLPSKDKDSSEMCEKQNTTMLDDVVLTTQSNENNMDSTRWEREITSVHSDVVLTILNNENKMDNESCETHNTSVIECTGTGIVANCIDDF